MSQYGKAKYGKTKYGKMKYGKTEYGKTGAYTKLDCANKEPMIPTVCIMDSG